jgi:hypothetical protein
VYTTNGRCSAIVKHFFSQLGGLGVKPLVYSKGQQNCPNLTSPSRFTTEGLHCTYIAMRRFVDDCIQQGDEEVPENNSNALFNGNEM